MRRLVPLAFLIWSCAHADQQGNSQPGDSKPAAEPAKPRPVVAKSPNPEHEPKPRPKSESGILLSASPEDSLTSNGLESLEQALVVRRFLDRARPHFDDAVRDALAKFQKGAGLPGTGMPDRETVRRLGLKTDDVFRR